MKFFIAFLLVLAWPRSGSCQSDIAVFNSTMLRNEQLLATAFPDPTPRLVAPPDKLAFTFFQPATQDTFPLIWGKKLNKLRYAGKHLTYKKFQETIAIHPLARKEFDKAKPYKIMVFVAAAASAVFSINQAVQDAKCTKRLKDGDLNCDIGGVGETATFAVFTLGAGVGGAIRFKKQFKKSINIFNQIQMHQQDLLLQKGDTYLFDKN